MSWDPPHSSHQSDSGSQRFTLREAGGLLAVQGQTRHTFHRWNSWQTHSSRLENIINILQRLVKLKKYLQFFLSIFFYSKENFAKMCWPSKDQWKTCTMWWRVSLKIYSVFFSVSSLLRSYLIVTSWGLRLSPGHTQISPVVNTFTLWLPPATATTRVLISFFKRFLSVTTSYLTRRFTFLFGVFFVYLYSIYLIT